MGAACAKGNNAATVKTDEPDPKDKESKKVVDDKKEDKKDDKKEDDKKTDKVEEKSDAGGGQSEADSKS